MPLNKPLPKEDENSASGQHKSSIVESSSGKGVTTYEILQKLSITEYPGGQRYVKVVFSKILDKESQEANQNTNFNKKVASAQRKQIMDIGSIEDAPKREL
jgi:hypothetical protein